MKKEFRTGLFVVFFLIYSLLFAAFSTWAEEQAPADQEAVTEDAGAALLPEEAVTEEAAGESGEDEVTLHGIRFSASYKEVYEVLLAANPYRYYWDDYYVEDAEAAVESAPLSSAANSSAAKAATDTVGASTDFSVTNLRELGVDEADIIKTDGSFIYILQDGNKVLMVKAQGPDLELTASFSLPEASGGIKGQAADLYVDRDILCVASSEYERMHSNTTDSWYSPWEDYTALYTYDISDKSNPQLTGTVTQEGSYQQSRKIGSHVYLYSFDYPRLEETFEESEIIPHVNGEEIPAEQICIPNVVTDAAYLIVSSVDLSSPDQIQDTKVLISGSGQFYVSQKNLYVMNQDYSGSSDRTEIVKFSCDKGKIEGVAGCYLKGYVNDSFSIDEYNGMLRVLTTYTGSTKGAVLEALSEILGFDYYDEDRWTRHNALYILDEDLSRISRLSDIAENEEIRSARYFGDTVYFVTFLNTDPLFTADLSDPAHPKLTGELKISGFSSYLHPYGDGRLLGIGYEADEDTGNVTGMKLSMFDTSDPANVTELSRYVIPGVTWCPAIADYKAILADADKNLIGFYCEDRYLVFSYDEEKGFERVLLYDFFEDGLNGTEDYNTVRGLYIGSELYLAGGHFAAAFDMEKGFEKDTVFPIE